MRTMNRKRGGWLVWLAAICFFFTQLAVAAYACSSATESATVQALASENADCHGSLAPLQDAHDAQLCKAHCEHGAQAKPSSLGDPADWAGAAMPLLFPRAAAVAAIEPCAYCRAPHGGPPLYLRHCVLRN